MVGVEQWLNELLMKLKADDHIWCGSQTNREQCNLKTVTELPRTEPVRKCLHHTAVSLACLYFGLSLPVHLKLTLQWWSLIVCLIHHCHYRFLHIQVLHIALGFPHCLVQALLFPASFLSWTDHYKTASCHSWLSLESSCHFILCHCAFKFFLPELCYCLSAVAVSHIISSACQRVSGSQNSTLCHS